MKGAYLHKKRRPDDIRRAFEYPQEAIRLEPGYAEPSYVAAMFYMFYVVSTVYGVLPSQSGLPEAEELLAKGLALDSRSATLNSTLGMLRMFQWRWAESEHALRTTPRWSAIRQLDRKGWATRLLTGSMWSEHTMRRLYAGLPSMIVIPVGEGVLMALVSLRPAAS